MSPLDSNQIEQKFVKIDDKFEKIDDKLEKQDEKIQNLEVDFAVMETKLINIENVLVRMENNYLSGNNLIHNIMQTQNQTLQSFAEELGKINLAIIDSQKNKDDNTRSVETNKNDNKNKIILGIFGLIGTVSAYFFGKGN